MHFWKKNHFICSSAGPKILAFGTGSHSSANFQPILDCFIPKYENSESRSLSTYIKSNVGCDYFFLGGGGGGGKSGT